MTEQATRAALASHTFLRGLNETQVAVLAACTKSVTAPAGELLGREGEPANAFYLLQTGRVAIEIHTPNRGQIRIQTVGPGEPVGWSWLVPPHRWQFDARAVDSVTALALDAGSLRDKCEQDHELGYQLLKRLVAVVSSRLAATRLQLLDIYK